MSNFTDICHLVFLQHDQILITECSVRWWYLCSLLAWQHMSFKERKLNWHIKGLLLISNPPSPVSAFARKPKTQEAEEGSSVIFEAETEKPDAKVKWQCNSKDIASDSKYIIAADGNKHSLTIKVITKEDASVYAVIAGGSKVKFELKVVSQPGGRLRCCCCAFEVSVCSPTGCNVITAHKAKWSTRCRKPLKQ